MFTPLIGALIYLAASFMLGLGLGFAIWKLGSSQQIKLALTETDFWRKRLDEARIKRDQDQERLKALEHTSAVLKKQLSTQAS